MNHDVKAADVADPEGVVQVEAVTAATAAEIQAAFTEWDRRYREDPERFTSEAVHLLKETPETYGQAVTPYFLAILAEIQGRRG